MNSKIGFTQPSQVFMGTKLKSKNTFDINLKNIPVCWICFCILLLSFALRNLCNAKLNSNRIMVNFDPS